MTERKLCQWMLIDKRVLKTDLPNKCSTLIQLTENKICQTHYSQRHKHTENGSFIGSLVLVNAATIIKDFHVFFSPLPCAMISDLQPYKKNKKYFV